MPNLETCFLEEFLPDHHHHIIEKTNMMDPRLIKVANNGDIDGLYALIGDKPFILEEVEKIPFVNTPLHLAVLSDKVCMVEELKHLKPSFTLKLNQDGFSPLHQASMFGKLEIVRVLLRKEGIPWQKKVNKAMNVDGDLCILKGREKRIPLHCAAISGQIDVLEELLSCCPESIEALTVRKESVLHLAAKFEKVEAFRILVVWLRKQWHHEILLWKDLEGNTALHLAASTGQHEIVEVLVQSSLLVKNVVHVNEINEAGLTALDLVMNLPSSNPDKEKTITLLSKAGAKKAEDIKGEVAVKCINHQEIESCSQIKFLSKNFKLKVGTYVPTVSSRIKILFKYFKLSVDTDIPSDARNALLVIVVLIATATYQTGVSPPGGYWQEDKAAEKNCTSNSCKQHFAGQAIWSTVAPTTYNWVMYFNLAGFMLSSLLSYNLTIGYPLRGPLLLALVFMLLTYTWSTPIFTNGSAKRPDSTLGTKKMMLWFPVTLMLIMWAITSNWMRQVRLKVLLFTGFLKP